MSISIVGLPFFEESRSSSTNRQKRIPRSRVEIYLHYSCEAQFSFMRSPIFPKRYLSADGSRILAGAFVQYCSIETRLVQRFPCLFKWGVCRFIPEILASLRVGVALSVCLACTMACFAKYTGQMMFKGSSQSLP